MRALTAQSAALQAQRQTQTALIPLPMVGWAGPPDALIFHDASPTLRYPMVGQCTPYKGAEICHMLLASMHLRELLQVYREGWRAVEEIQIEERRSASLQLRWRQLNSAYGLAKGLGLLQPDPDEIEVFKRWAILKEKAISKNLAA